MYSVVGDFISEEMLAIAFTTLILWFIHKVYIDNIVKNINPYTDLPFLFYNV